MIYVIKQPGTFDKLNLHEKCYLFLYDKTSIDLF